jgi:peptidoglycan/LPS O-acetylase OafA/YrhL
MNDKAAKEATLRTPAAPRYQTLDAWRGLACLMIVVAHAGLGLPISEWNSSFFVKLSGAIFSRLYLGVPFFFVISGYCIAATADSGRRHPFSAARYFVRRFRRIFPPYFAALLLTGGTAIVVAEFADPTLVTEGNCFIPNPLALDAWQWIGNLTLTESWRYHFADGIESRQLLLGPAWTLCYEEQFYAVCGFALWVSRRHFFLTIAAITALTLPLTTMSFSSLEPIVRYFFFDGRWLLFAAGIGLYYHVNYAENSGRWHFLSLIMACIVLAAILRYGVDGLSAEQRLLAFEWVAGFSFAALLAILQPADSFLAKCSFLAPMMFLGRLCYSLYLTHYVIAVLLAHYCYRIGLRGANGTILVTIPLVTLLSILVAWMFHAGIESRFLNTRTVR